MYVPSETPKYICYKCRNKIRTNDLEEIFHQQLKNFFFSPTQILEYLAKADTQVKEKQELLGTLQQEQQKIQREIDKTYQLYYDDKIDKEGFGIKYEPLNERNKQVEEQIPQLQAGIDFLKIQYASSDEILHETKDLYSRWPQLNHEEKRKVIECITEKITVGKDDIAIDLSYLPSSVKKIATSHHNPTDCTTPPKETPRNT